MSQEEKKITKLKFDDIEYNFDDLPEEAKNLDFRVEILN